ncbi:MAG: GNAT family N-acetyltransferase [Pirellulales bacterium]
MVRFRRFQNSDPPLLTRLWQQQMPARGRMLGISTAVLEGMIFSKTYFDHDGFWVAEDEGNLVGCAHAWPLPDEMGSAVGGGKAGTTGLLLVLPHAKQEEIASELLRQTESYLQRQQCSQIFGGNACRHLTSSILGFTADAFRLAFWRVMNCLYGRLSSGAM